MAKRLQFRRLFWLALLLGAAFAGLGYRLVDIQVVRHEELKAKAEKNTQREYVLEQRRGDILDAKGNLLATTTYLKRICADPVLIRDRQAEVAGVLAPLLGESEARLVEKLQIKVSVGAGGKLLTNRSVVLKKRVPVETWQQIRQAMTNLTFGINEKKLPRSEAAYYTTLRTKAVYDVNEPLRVYPNQRLAAHIIGFAQTQDQEVNNRTVLQLVGADGIEQSFDEKLAGVRGWRVTEAVGKREIVTLRDQNIEPRDGLNVVLTIDSVVQHIVENALEEGVRDHNAVAACGLVVRPQTGQILAMTSWPNFDPSTPSEATRNRAIADRIEPGSTFKVVPISAALNENTVQLTDVFYCEQGVFRYAGRALHDHARYKNLTVEGIITKSSNIGAAKVGITLGEQRLYKYMRDFGFGAPTGIPLQAEVAGIVHPVKSWSKVSIAQIPMGQGIAVTPLQMTMAMCALANKGALMRPMIVDRLEDRDGQIVAKYSPQRVRQVVTEHTAREMVGALKTVVSSEGTAPKAALEHYTVAGKTGTAQKAERVGDRVVYVKKYFSSFIGFFPADNPEVCIAVMFDEPDPKIGYYGGEVAGPVFKRIAERAANYLDIKPEDDSGKPVPASVAAIGELKAAKGGVSMP